MQITASHNRQNMLKNRDLCAPLEVIHFRLNRGLSPASAHLHDVRAPLTAEPGRDRSFRQTGVCSDTQPPARPCHIGVTASHHVRARVYMERSVLACINHDGLSRRI